MTEISTQSVSSREIVKPIFLQDLFKTYKKRMVRWLVGLVGFDGRCVKRNLILY